MARFRRIRNDAEDEKQFIPTHAEVNQRMQTSAKASIGGGLGAAIEDAVMSGIKVIISMVALVIVLWMATGFQTR